MAWKWSMNTTFIISGRLYFVQATAVIITNLLGCCSNRGPQTVLQPSSVPTSVEAKVRELGRPNALYLQAANSEIVTTIWRVPEYQYAVEGHGAFIPLPTSPQFSTIQLPSSNIMLTSESLNAFHVKLWYRPHAQMPRKVILAAK